MKKRRKKSNKLRRRTRSTRSGWLRKRPLPTTRREFLELSGGALAAWGAWGLLVALRRVLLNSRRSADQSAALGILGAVAAASIHSAFDFGLSVPANALTLGAIIGATGGIKRGSPEDRGKGG